MALTNREYCYNHRHANPVNYLVAKAKKNSKKSGVDFSLTKDDLVMPETCPILGLKLRVGKTSKQDYSPSLDRLYPEKGYVKDNVNIISWRANHLKNNGTLEEFRKLVKWLEEQEASRAEMA